MPGASKHNGRGVLKGARPAGLRQPLTPGPCHPLHLPLLPRQALTTSGPRHLLIPWPGTPSHMGVLKADRLAVSAQMSPSLAERLK